MGFITTGTSYGMLGGTSAETKRRAEFVKMQLLAKQAGLLGEDESRPDPSGFKSLFMGAVDIISRPNYAVAGFVDTLAGNGRPGEYAMTRVFRELLSGIGPIQGDKEMFGDVLEQAGLPEGAKLSDLVGENGLTKRFNPTTRGAVGLALDIFLDPLTYVSAPVKNASTILGVGGEIKYLNEAGREALAIGYRAQLDEWRTYLGLAKDTPEVVVLDRLRSVPKFMQEQAETARGLIQSGAIHADEGGQVFATGFSQTAVRDALTEKAGKALFESGAGADLLEKAGMRFRIPGTPIDVPIGADRLAVESARRLSSFMRKGMSKSDIGRAMWEFGDEVVADVHKLFSRHPLGVMSNKAYLRLEDRRFRMNNAAEHVAGQEIDTLLGGLTKAQLNDRELWYQFARAVEDRVGDGEKLFVEMAKEKGVVDPERLLRGWRGLFDRVGSVEAASGLLDGNKFAAWQGHYFPRVLRHREQDFAGKFRVTDEGIRADIHQFKNGRMFDTWDEYVEAVLEKGGRESDIVFNPREAGAARLAAHYRALVNQQFLGDVSQRFGLMQNEQVARIAKILQKSGAHRLSATEQKKVAKLAEADVEMLSKAGAADGADIAAFRKLRPEVRAHYLASLLDRVDDLEGLVRYIEKYEDDLFDVNTKLSDIVDGMFEGKTLVLRDQFGKQYVNAEFAGRRMAVPAPMAEDIAEFNKRFKPTEEAGRLLRTYDTLNNWWKVGVTRWFPSFYGRNSYSNMASVYTDVGIAAFNPVYAKRAADVMRGADGTLPIRGGGRITFAAFRGELDAMGISVEREMIAEITGNVKSDPFEWIADHRLKAGGRGEKIWAGAEKLHKAPGVVENHARIMHALILRQRGYAPHDVAHQVNKYLVDYNDLSATDKGVFKRLFPFWVWTKHNAVLQFKNLVEHPGRMAATAKVTMQDRGPAGDHLPEYMRGQMSMRLEAGPNGEHWLTGIDLPFNSMDVLWAGSLGKTFREQIGMLTPFIKTPLEVGANQDFFTGNEVRGVGRISPRLGAAIARNLPPKMQDWFELENTGTKADPQWQANRLKIHLVFKGLFLSRFVSEGLKLDEFAKEIGNGDENAGLRAAMRMLIGLDLRNFDADDKQRRALFNNSRRLEDMLLDKGLMREFQRRYIPRQAKGNSFTPILEPAA